MPDIQEADRILEASRLPRPPLYLVGIFNTGVTVLSQQRRALNLVWALVERHVISVRPPGAPIPEDKNDFKIAVIGGGFAGLSVAAGLIRKGALAQLTIFEQRDTLLPLQHGSDTRWLHPNIYDWPAEGSETNSAMLPVLNWTAARASDVVVQVLSEWQVIVDDPDSTKPHLYCNTRHLQLRHVGSKVQIEWIGERRDPADGNTVQIERAGERRKPANGTTRDSKGVTGKTELFDLVILTVGYGLERDNALSYWRNDTIGQPNLEKPRVTYLISGQGDGAMIDLLRLRISHYRQDRILRELFGKARKLVPAVETIYQQYYPTEGKQGIFDAFEQFEQLCPADFDGVCNIMRRRLRRDTEVILHLKPENRVLANLFESRRISFQNKLLVYLLYKCGGFVPSSLEEGHLAEQHSIPRRQIIRRHGTLPLKQLQECLSEELFEKIKTLDPRPGRPLAQSPDPAWPGGYFGYTGLTADAESGTLDSKITLKWRKEYLPPPTELLAATLSSSIAGLLLHHHMERSRLRVTLHRAVMFGQDELLQQSCEYFGVDPSPPEAATAARTFPTNRATIGLAYETRRIVRSVRDIRRETLQQAMQQLEVTRASSRMSQEVQFILAIPILEPEEVKKFTDPAPVAGVLYIDSTAPGFYVCDVLLKEIVSALNCFIAGLEKESADIEKRIFNVPLSKLGEQPRPKKLLPTGVVSEALELVAVVEPPRTLGAFQFNFEYSDFIPVKTGWPT